MAHRLVWKSAYDDKVSIFERGGKPLKGIWRCDDKSAQPLVVRGITIREYTVREWLGSLECRATLEKVDSIENSRR